MIHGAEATAELQDKVLESFRAIVPGMQATLGPHCEVVLHDYRRPNASVVAIAGNVTGRQLNSAMSEVGLRIMAQGDQAHDDVNYLAQLPTGQEIKSSTLLLRDDKDHVFGALCINVDVTAIRQVGRMMDELVGAKPAIPTALPTFSTEPESMIDAAIHDISREVGRPLRGLSPEERRDVLRALEARGIFRVRGATNRIAEHLGISRATAYKSLAAVRREGDLATSAGTSTDEDS